MSDYAATSAHRMLLQIERDQAASLVVDTRHKLAIIGGDLRTKGSALDQSDVIDLMVIAAEIDRLTASIRSCAVSLMSAHSLLAEQIAERARMRGHEL